MNNPLANEGIISKVKKVFTSDKKTEDNVTAVAHSYFIGCNNAIPICAEACACCWDRPIPEGYESKANYVAKRTEIGHTSVIEHSNFIMLISFNSYIDNEAMQFLSWCKYLGTTLVTNGYTSYLILYGSFRAYADVIKECSWRGNIIYDKMLGILYKYAPSEMFKDIIADGLVSENEFANAYIEMPKDYIIATDETYEDDYIKIIGIDSIQDISKKIHNVAPAVTELLSLYDYIKMATITVLFKGMSRTSTHQLVRHRNAITQESQRYVDYSDASFANPMDFKPEKYDKNHKYDINFGPSGRMQMTLEEIGNAEINIYNQIYAVNRAGADYALLKEDARSILPSNVKCNKIYVTFTYKNLLKFLNLREDKHAQAEIRFFATRLGNIFRTQLMSNTYFDTKEKCDEYTKPRLLIDSAHITVDEDMGIEEETVPTDDDYIKAAGLNEEENSKEETNNGI